MGSLLNQDCIHICVDHISWLFPSHFPATIVWCQLPLSSKNPRGLRIHSSGSLWRSWGGIPVQASCLHWHAVCRDCTYFSMHKQCKAMTIKLRNCVQILQVLSVSSAACERGFSQMNRPHTAVRNGLAVTTLSDLLIISINSLCLRDWNVDKYVLSWLKNWATRRFGKSSSPK